MFNKLSEKEILEILDKRETEKKLDKIQSLTSYPNIASALWMIGRTGQY